MFSISLDLDYFMVFDTILFVSVDLEKLKVEITHPI